MLSSIHPLGERSRKSSWRVTVIAHALGGAAGGATIGLIAAALGWLLVGWAPASVRLVVLGAGALVALASETNRFSMRLPSVHRQVNEAWLDEYRGWVYGSGFGYQLGLGIVTIITTATVHLLLLAALLSASPLAGLAIGLAFGLVRGSVVLTGRRITSPVALRSFHQRLSGLAPKADLVARWSLALTAVVSGAAVAGVLVS